MAKKARRTAVNTTGIKRIEGIPYHDAWISYSCLKCNSRNYERIGQELLTPKIAFENQSWDCSNCGYKHSKTSELPFDNWDEDISDPSKTPTQRFWEGFFRTATEEPEAYWKQCNACGRVLPFKAFSKHSGWGPLERQIECRACKGGINAVLNPKRTKDQLHESAVRRRIADLFVKDIDQTVNIDDLFERFSSKCFKTGKKLVKDDRATWHIDHIMPSLYLWPLSIENAALLSVEANSKKKAKWPSEFFNNNQLLELARITGANIELLSSEKPIINKKIDVNGGVEKYLTVRDHSNLPKRISEIKQILEDYGLVDQLNVKNKKLLGYS